MRIVTCFVAIGALANLGTSAYAEFVYEAVPYVLAPREYAYWGANRRRVHDQRHHHYFLQ